MTIGQSRSSFIVVVVIIVVVGSGGSSSSTNIDKENKTCVVELAALGTKVEVEGAAIVAIFFNNNYNLGDRNSGNRNSGRKREI